MDTLLQLIQTLAAEPMVQLGIGLGALTGLLVGAAEAYRKFKKPQPPVVVPKEEPFDELSGYDQPSPEDYVVEELPPEAPDPARKPDASTEARPLRTPRVRKQVDAEGEPVIHTKEETMLVGKKNKRSDTLRRNKTR